MSWSSAPVPALLLLPLLFLLNVLPTRTASGTVSALDISFRLKSCAPVDVAELQEYVTSLNTTGGGASLGLNDAYVHGRSSELLLLPFGALASDWTRLLLLQNGQPEGTPLRDHLLRLSRLMLAAYFEAVDRSDWKVPVNHGQDEAHTNPASVPELESEDQQANNATLGSTAQKESIWINGSSVDVAATTVTYNNEEQPRSGNSSGNQSDSTMTTTSHYDSSILPTETSNFNQTFSTLSADNKTSGSKSNETFDIDNEDESSQLAAETSPDFFDTTPTLVKDLRGDKNQSSEEIIPEDRSFTSAVVSGDKSSENSKLNEAIHERSKEEFVVSQYKEKESKNEDGSVARFAEPVNDESAAGNRIKSDFEDFSAMVEKANKSLGWDSMKSSEESKDSEEPSPLITKSFEDFFHDDNVDNNNNDNKKTLAGNSSVEKEDSLEFNLTKSIEDFFLSAENSTDKQNANATKPSFAVEYDIKSEEELLTQSIEDFFKDDGPNYVNGTSSEVEDKDFSSASAEAQLTQSIEDFFANEEALNVTMGTDTEIVDNFFNKLESNEEVEATSNETHEFRDIAVESTTLSELLVSATTLRLYPTEDPSTENTESANIQKDDDVDFDKLISEELVEGMLGADRSAESNSTGNDNPGTETTTTLAQLISGRFSMVYSNEITATPANEMEDRSAKYLDTLAATTTISPSTRFPGDQDKAAMEAHTEASSSSELDGNPENQTTNRADDLFRETTPATQQLRPEEYWSSTILTSIEPATSEAPALSPLSRRILMTFRNETVEAAPASGELRKPEVPSEGEEDVWKLKESALNPSTTESLRNQERDRRNGIAAGAIRNKRKSRKRTDAELDVESQYRTFFGLE